MNGKVKTKYYLDLRLLAIFGVLAALPLLGGFFLIQGSARVRLIESIGQDFSKFADYAASSIDQAVSREVVLLSALGKSPDLIRAAAEASRKYAPATNPSERLLKREQEWEKYGPDHPQVKAVLETEPSRHLASVVSDSEVHEELTLLDAAGAVIAASRKPARFYFGDRPWFREALAGAEGEGSIAFSDVRRFRELDQDVIAIAWPVRDTASEIVGVLRAVVDTRTLFQAIDGFRFGKSGHALLIQGDGEVLAGTVTECVSQGRYQGIEEYRRAAQEKAAYFVSGVTPTRRTEKAELVGYARPQIASSQAHLDWTVFVEQPLGEAHAPLAALNRDLILYFLGMGVAVLLLAFYVSFKLEEPVTDIEMDLHHDLRKSPSR